MRGKLIQAIVNALPQRITPADAGKTCLQRQSPRSGRDHPRGCGENVAMVNCSTVGVGSPPRMRGKPKPFEWFAGIRGITPADAGKTKKIL